MRLHDTLLGLVFMIGAAAFFATTFTFPEFVGQRHGPALFPRLLALGIFACGLVIAVRGRRGSAPWLAWRPELAQPRRLIAFLAIPGAVLLYLLVAERLGFIPTAAFVVGGLSWLFGVRAWKAALLGVAVALAVQWFFGSLMRVPLPRGLFMALIAGG